RVAAGNREVALDGDVLCAVYDFVRDLVECGFCGLRGRHSLPPWSKPSYERPGGGTAVVERTCEVRFGVGRCEKKALRRGFAGPEVGRGERDGAGCDHTEGGASYDQERG